MIYEIGNLIIDKENENKDIRKTCLGQITTNELIIKECDVDFSTTKKSYRENEAKLQQL